jgi:hypothetical protein
MRPRVHWLQVIASVIAAASLLSAGSGPAHAEDTSYYIMKPEPWLGPKYKSPRGTVQHVKPVMPVHPSDNVPVRGFTPPPPIVSPSTGQIVPTIPITPSQPATVGGRTESFSDRAVRCSHQAAAAGQAVGNNPSASMGSCINQ